MNDRVIIKGFYNQDSATHTYTIPTPKKPIGFEYSNKQVEGNDECSDENNEERSVFHLDYAMQGFRPR